ncbi:MAG TPA: hypothetical protein VJN02_08910, partial [Gammaproteobacteria bacterium]|nr:hypothetical protein [Gammaproteobacteria bacterium]
ETANVLGTILNALENECFFEPSPQPSPALTAYSLTSIQSGRGRCYARPFNSYLLSFYII